MRKILFYYYKSHLTFFGLLKLKFTLQIVK